MNNPLIRNNTIRSFKFKTDNETLFNRLRLELGQRLTNYLGSSDFCIEFTFGAFMRIQNDLFYSSRCRNSSFVEIASALNSVYGINIEIPELVYENRLAPFKCYVINNSNRVKFSRKMTSYLGMDNAVFDEHYFVFDGEFLSISHSPIDCEYRQFTTDQIIEAIDALMPWTGGEENNTETVENEREEFRITYDSSTYSDFTVPHNEAVSLSSVGNAINKSTNKKKKDWGEDTDNIIKDLKSLLGYTKIL